LTTDSIVPILFLVKKFRKRGEFEGKQPFSKGFFPSKIPFEQILLNLGNFWMELKRGQTLKTEINVKRIT